MPTIRSSHVEVYVFRRVRRAVQCLALRRSPGKKLAGVWQPVTGKPHWGEPAAAAAMREVHEETGFRPLRWWALETVSVYFDAEADTLELLPLFAAEVSAKDSIRLSREHDAWKFVSAKAAGRLYLWEAQRTGLAAVAREVLARPQLSRALELESHPPRKRRRKPS